MGISRWNQARCDTSVILVSGLADNEQILSVLDEAESLQ